MKRTPRGLVPRAAYAAVAAALAVGMVGPPASAANGDHPWLDTSRAPAERASLLVDALTLDQKIQQIGIVAIDESDVLEGCAKKTTGRTIEGIPELGVPNFRMTNGGTGVKGGSCNHDPVATGLPSTPGMAATFDRGLNYSIGKILGEETYAYAHQVMLGPSINLIRTPFAGRAFEYPSEDPFLAGMVGVEQTRGIQSQGIQGQIKHFAFNDQEEERWTAAVNLPPRAANELYLIPFEMAVKEGDVASVMCAFPYINGTWACENGPLLQTVLYDRWGYDGWTMSDRRATHSTVESIKAGMGVELDFAPEWYTPELIKMHIDAGDLEESDLDALLLPRYTKMIEFGQFEDHFLEFGETDLDAHGEIAREIAEDGMVLLKNEGDLLPLDGDEETVALIGVHEFAGQAKLPPRSGNDFGETVVAPYKVSPKRGLENVINDLGSDTEIVRADGTDLEEAVDVADDADVVLLVVGDAATETRDKTTLGFPEFNGVDQEELIDAVVGVNPNTVVVLKTTGFVLMPWLDEVPAVLEAWYPGQEDGNAFARIVYGLVNPSGKLPVTFGNTDKEAAFATDRQYPGVRVDNGMPGGGGFEGEPGVEQLNFYYDEDLEMGYRWYEANDVTPTFAFGHGLSYTTFEYSDLEVTPTTNVAGTRAVTVEFDVKNTGDRAGAEAAQVYLDLPDLAGQPSKRLVGFDKKLISAGDTEHYSVTIDSAAGNHPFGYFLPDEGGTWADGDWVNSAGEYTVHVAAASDDVRLSDDVDLDFPEGPEPGDGDIPIIAEVPGSTDGPGSLTLTIGEFDGVVDLGTGRTNEGRFRFDGDLPVIEVVDSRNDAQAGSSGWSVAGRADDFTAAESTFSASYLGWLPWATTDDARAGVTPGPRVDGTLRGGPGLAVPATLVRATNADRLGSATAGAHLLLEIPLDTPPGDYRSSISLSLFPVD